MPTKKRSTPGMGLVPAQAVSGAGTSASYAPPLVVSAPVFVARPHLVFQHPADQLGDGGALLGGSFPGPQRRLLAHADGDLSQQEFSVTRGQGRGTCFGVQNVCLSIYNRVYCKSDLRVRPPEEPGEPPQTWDRFPGRDPDLRGCAPGGCGRTAGLRRGADDRLWADGASHCSCRIRTAWRTPQTRERP